MVSLTMQDHPVSKRETRIVVERKEHLPRMEKALGLILYTVKEIKVLPWSCYVGKALLWEICIILVSLGHSHIIYLLQWCTYSPSCMGS